MLVDVICRNNSFIQVELERSSTCSSYRNDRIGRTFNVDYRIRWYQLVYHDKVLGSRYVIRVHNGIRHNLEAKEECRRKNRRARGVSRGSANSKRAKKVNGCNVRLFAGRIGRPHADRDVTAEAKFPADWRVSIPFAKWCHPLLGGMTSFPGEMGLFFDPKT